MNPAIKCLLIPLSLMCCHSPLVAQTPSAEDFSLDPSNESPSLSDLVRKESDLEQALNNLEVGGAWDFQMSELLLELADVKRDLGNETEASQLYNQLMLNLRVNLGLYSTDQLPIILELMERNLEQAEYKVADELGDWAEFLYERAYSDEDDLDNLVAGYNKIISIRLGAPRSHRCFELDLTVEGYDHIDNGCKFIRRDRAEHFISAFQLQRKTVELLDQNPQIPDLLKLQQRARLAKISIVTAGIVNGTDEIIGVTRRRYDSEYYFNTSYRLIRQLEKDYPLLNLD